MRNPAAAISDMSTHSRYTQLRSVWRTSVWSTAQYGRNLLNRRVTTAGVASMSGFRFAACGVAPGATPQAAWSGGFRELVQPGEAALVFLLYQVEVRLLGLHPDATHRDERDLVVGEHLEELGQERGVGRLLPELHLQPAVPQQYLREVLQATQCCDRARDRLLLAVEVQFVVVLADAALQVLQ